LPAARDALVRLCIRTPRLTCNFHNLRAATRRVRATGGMTKRSTCPKTVRRLRRSSATVDDDVVTTTSSRPGTRMMDCPPNPHAKYDSA
jgi:hypothetical protein